MRDNGKDFPETVAKEGKTSKLLRTSEERKQERVAEVERRDENQSYRFKRYQLPINRI